MKKNNIDKIIEFYKEIKKLNRGSVNMYVFDVDERLLKDNKKLRKDGYYGTEWYCYKNKTKENWNNVVFYVKNLKIKKE